MEGFRRPAALTAADRELLAAADALLVEVRAQHEVQAINRALDAIWKVVADANRYFAAQEPWALEEDRSGAHGERCSM